MIIQNDVNQILKYKIDKQDVILNPWINEINGVNEKLLRDFLIVATFLREVSNEEYKELLKSYDNYKNTDDETLLKETTIWLDEDKTVDNWDISDSDIIITETQMNRLKEIIEKDKKKSKKNTKK